MINMKLISALFTLSTLTWGVFEVKDYLNENFVKKDTKIKRSLNNFLNGDQNKDTD